MYKSQFIFCTFHFRTLNHQSPNTSKRLHNSQRLQDGTTLFLKLRKQQYILKFLTNHSRFGALIIITLLYNFLRVEIRIDDFTSPKTLTELESFIAHSSLAGLGSSALAKFEIHYFEILQGLEFLLQSSSKSRIEMRTCDLTQLLISSHKFPNNFSTVDLVSFIAHNSLRLIR